MFFSLFYKEIIKVIYAIFTVEIEVFKLNLNNKYLLLGKSVI